MKQCFEILVHVSLVAGLVVARGGGSGQTVHLTATNVAQKSVTTHKEDSLTLVNGSSATHILQNGTPKQMTKSGKPTESYLPLSTLSRIPC
jgi:hypothetical protein